MTTEKKPEQGTPDAKPADQKKQDGTPAHKPGDGGEPIPVQPQAVPKKE